MTDKTRAPKPGYVTTDGVRDSELWRAVAANLRAEYGDLTAADPDREMGEALAGMLDRAATDSDAGLFTPEYAEALDRLAAVVATMFAVDWTVS